MYCSVLPIKKEQQLQTLQVGVGCVSVKSILGPMPLLSSSIEQVWNGFGLLCLAALGLLGYGPVCGGLVGYVGCLFVVGV
jgi:hypothetical protein